MEKYNRIYENILGGFLFFVSGHKKGRAAKKRIAPVEPLTTTSRRLRHGIDDGYQENRDSLVSKCVFFLLSFPLTEGAESSQRLPVGLQTAAAFGRNEIFIARSGLESHSGVCVCLHCYCAR